MIMFWELLKHVSTCSRGSLLILLADKHTLKGTGKNITAALLLASGNNEWLGEMTFSWHQWELRVKGEALNPPGGSSSRPEDFHGRQEMLDLCPYFLHWFNVCNILECCWAWNTVTTSFHSVLGRAWACARSWVSRELSTSECRLRISIWAAVTCVHSQISVQKGDFIYLVCWGWGAVLTSFTSALKDFRWHLRGTTATACVMYLNCAHAFHCVWRALSWISPSHLCFQSALIFVLWAVETCWQKWDVIEKSKDGGR